MLKAIGMSLDALGVFTTLGWLRRTAVGTYVTDTIGNLQGTSTNDNAGAGKVGEVITSTVLIGSHVSLSNNTDADITSISLTAGDWKVWGSVVTDPNAATTTSSITAWLSATTATLPTAPNSGGEGQQSSALLAGVPQIVTAGIMRVSVGSTTTIFLSTRVGFAVNVMFGYGFIGARRMR